MFRRKIDSLSSDQNWSSKSLLNDPNSIRLEDFINTEVGYYAMKKFLISEFSPEGIMFLTESYFLKRKMEDKGQIVDISIFSGSKPYVQKIRNP